MHNPLLLPEIRAMIAEKDHPGLSDVMTELHPASIAEFSEGLTEEETWELLSHSDVHRQAEVFPFFSADKELQLVKGWGKERISKLLEAMSHDDRVDLLKRCDEGTVESLLPLIAKADREDIRRLLTFPEHQAGSVMTTDYATLPPDITVQAALDQLRKQAPDKETIYYVYVVDDERHLMGFVSLRDLILARPSALIRDSMTEDVVTVRADQDQEEVARELAKYDFLALPVVDDQNRIIGIVTHDDVLDVLEEEATEDALRMGGVGVMADNYLESPFTTIWRKRAMWLSCLFVAELFTFTALAHYEEAIASVIVLSLFVPLCISTGGNSGSQAATLITRAMALGQVTPALWWRVLRHELLMGLALGLTLGAIGFCRAAVTPKSILDSAEVFEEEIEILIPSASPLLPQNGTVQVPEGSRLLHSPLKRSAIAHFPDQPEFVESTTEGYSMWRFPAQTELRTPASIRWNLAIVIGQSVAVICIWGTLVGSMLPLAFRKLGFDPGYASSPFVATFVDVTGIVIYFSIAKLWLL